MTEKLTLSIREAAEAIGISENTLRQSIREGRIPAIRVSERRLVIPRFALSKMLESGGAPITTNGIGD